MRASKAEALKAELAAALIMAAAEAALLDIAAERSAAGRLQTIMAACAFQDLVGQRLSKVSRLVGGEAEPADALLNGPAAAGEGLSQAEADALFG